ncbi:unnamed protein product [Adineta ricciae]|uniref:SHSP domain-containing protein n=1 Tax=Adineta ricciae TaxID=249248 RepID=A0A814IDZ6_ADIRI|nr:unnamed protein product [Adineta ricciae]CAF1224825.1 unnamed protein product [Adineta ricciae]
MALARVTQRLFVPRLAKIVGSQTGSTRHFFHRHHYHKYLPETSFASMANVFQRWEKEFERMQGQFNKFFQDSKTDRSVMDLTFDGNNKLCAAENDFIITEPDGSRKFHLSLNTHGFGPEDIKIKVQQGSLSVSAKKEKKSTNGYSLHEFSQTYSLPEELNIDQLKSTYTENGILAIEAPLPEAKTKNRQIEIERIK